MKVEVLNQSYVRKNYLSSFASYPCTVIFLRLPVCETLIRWLLDAQYLRPVITSYMKNASSCIRAVNPAPSRHGMSLLSRYC